MFNTYVTKVDGGGPKHVTVTEKRTPTDESVRLLKEFEKEAESKVLRAGKIENWMNGNWFIIQNPMNLELTLRLVYEINGKVIDQSFNIHRLDIVDNMHNLQQFVGEKIADVIAGHMTIDLFLTYDAEGFNYGIV